MAASPTPPTPGRANRIGLALFAVYCLCYAVFIGLAAFGFSTLATVPFAGVNLAVIAGFGLILLAFVLALIYLRLDHGEERP